MRGHLKKVCALESIPFTAEITEVESNGRRLEDGSIEDAYQVVLTKKSAVAKAEELKRQQLQQTQLNFQKSLVTVAKGMCG